MAENVTVDPKDAQDNKVMAILAYLGILFLVPLFAAKESPFARFHTNQGILLCIAGICVGIISGILINISWTIGMLIYSVCGLALFVLMIIGIINAAKGEAKELPVIGKYRILK